MTVSQAFAAYLASTQGLTLGQNLFISRVPSSNKVSDPVFWIKSYGGPLLSRSIQGRASKQYVIEVYFRAYGAETVDETLQALGEALTPKNITLAGYDLQDADTNGPWTDQDLDDEERTVGLLQVKLLINEENS